MHPWPADSSSNFGEVGGEAAVALTWAQNGPHTHDYLICDGGSGSGSSYPQVTKERIPNVSGKTDTSGSGEPHNNMPPYARMKAHVRAA